MIDTTPEYFVDPCKAMNVTYKPYTISGKPTNFRFAKRPDGSIRLQGGYEWTEGYQAGVQWKDIPMVEVDEEGTLICRD